MIRRRPPRRGTLARVLEHAEKGRLKPVAYKFHMRQLPLERHERCESRDHRGRKDTRLHHRRKL